MSPVEVLSPLRESCSRADSAAEFHAETGVLPSPKLQPWHLARRAIVYVRQSTPQQIIDHHESTSRQYALVDRAVALGWSRAQVLVIDDDQGQSGQSAEGRPGFQRLLAEVGLDRVGLILGLEMSRLARSCKDWYQLLELCAVFRALLADQDGLYDPTDFNDRLLLGLKGTMSEAELHILKGRMYQGRLHKARRGELLVHAPIGYVQSPDGDFAFDPDEQAQAVVKLIFVEFPRQGSLYALLRYLVRHAIGLPVRPLYGPNRGMLEWRRPCRETLQSMLHHPIYAGAYRYGHRRTDLRKKVPGRRSTGRTINRPEDCLVLIRDRFPAYISWEQFEENQERLARNQARAAAMGAPRNGPSLLGGLLYCGRCGQRLMVQYSGRANRLRYQCGRAAQQYGEPLCFGVAGRELDDFVAERVLKVLEPASLELCLAATDDLEHERERLDQHWRQRLQRAHQEADRAARQYHAVEPENRLVARTLEQQWEKALREQEQLTAEYEAFRCEHPARLTDDQRMLIRRLSQDIPAVWHAPETTSQDRQQIVRLLLDRIDVNAEDNSERVDLTMHWAGGFTSRHQHTRSVAGYDQLSNRDELLARIVALRQTGYTLAQVAAQLNQEGFHPPKRNCRFTAQMLSRLLLKRGLHRPRAETRLDGAPLGSHEWWLKDLARQLDMPAATLNRWREVGWVDARKVAIAGGRWVLWADESELARLRRLRSHPRGWSDTPYPAELTTPKSRSDK
jgi:DNA invertase Pin-like site-specific DNA recombinase